MSLTQVFSIKADESPDADAIAPPHIRSILDCVARGVTRQSRRLETVGVMAKMGPDSPGTEAAVH